MTSLARLALARFLAAGLLAAATPATTHDLAWLKGFESASGVEAPAFHSNASADTGRALYQIHCVACHGVRGRGDGPAAAGLHPPPADLVLHASQHNDGELFYYIARGVPGTAMPAWRGVLSADERWQLVHYVHELGAGRP